MTVLLGSTCSLRLVPSSCPRCIVIQHVGQNVLRILQPLGHLLVIRIKGLAKWHDRPLTFFVDVGDETIVRVEQDLCMVLKVHLYNLIRQTEHDGVPRAHPLLNVDRAGLAIARPLRLTLRYLCGMLMSVGLLGSA